VFDFASWNFVGISIAQPMPSGGKEARNALGEECKRLFRQWFPFRLLPMIALNALRSRAGSCKLNISARKGKRRSKKCGLFPLLAHLEHYV
jgi:hypothetical protein